MASSDEVRTSSWEEHRTTDLVEGQLQFSTRSHQKEGSFLSLPYSSHHWDLLQPQPQLQLLQERLNLRWKSAWHQMLLISLWAPALNDDNLQSPPPLLQIQSYISSSRWGRWFLHFWVHVRTPLQVQDSRSATISTLRYEHLDKHLINFHQKTTKKKI